MQEAFVMADIHFSFVDFNHIPVDLRRYREKVMLF